MACSTISIPARAGRCCGRSWSIEGPADLAAIHPKLRCLDATSAFDIDGFDRLSTPHRIVTRIVELVPGMKRTAVFYRLEF